MRSGWVRILGKYHSSTKAGSYFVKLSCKSSPAFSKCFSLICIICASKRQYETAFWIFYSIFLIQTRLRIIYPAITSPIADIPAKPGIFAGDAGFSDVFPGLAVSTGDTTVFAGEDGDVCCPDNLVSSVWQAEHFNPVCEVNFPILVKACNLSTS